MVEKPLSKIVEHSDTPSAICSTRESHIKEPPKNVHTMTQYSLLGDPSRVTTNDDKTWNIAIIQDDRRIKENTRNELLQLISPSFKENDVNLRHITKTCGNYVSRSLFELSKSISTNKSFRIDVDEQQLYHEEYFTAPSSIHHSSADTSFYNKTYDKFVNEPEREDTNEKNPELDGTLPERKQTSSPFPKLYQAINQAQYNSVSNPILNPGFSEKKGAKNFYPAFKADLLSEFEISACKSSHLSSLSEKKFLQSHNTSKQINPMGSDDTLSEFCGIEQHISSDPDLIKERIPLERDVSQMLRRKSGFSMYSQESIATFPEQNQSEWACQQNLGIQTEHLTTCSELGRRTYIDPDAPINWSQPHITKVKVNHHPEDSFTFPIFSSSATLSEILVLNPEFGAAKFEAAQRRNVNYPKRRDDSATEWETIQGSNAGKSDGISEKSRSGYLVGGTIKCCSDSVADTSDAGYDFEALETGHKFCHNGKNNATIYRSRASKLYTEEKKVSSAKPGSQSSESNNQMTHHQLFTPNCSVPRKKIIQIHPQTSISELADQKLKFRKTLQKIIDKSSLKDLSRIKGVKVVQFRNHRRDSINGIKGLVSENHKYDHSLTQLEKNRSDLGKLGGNSDDTKQFKLADNFTDNCSENLHVLTLESPNPAIESTKYTEDGQDLDLITSFSKNECIVAYYEDGPRVFGKGKTESIHDMEWNKSDSWINFKADDLTDPNFKRSDKKFLPDLIHEPFESVESLSDYSRSINRRSWSTNLHFESPVNNKIPKHKSMTNHLARRKENSNLALNKLRYKSKRPDQAHFRDRLNHKTSLGSHKREWKTLNSHPEVKGLWTQKRTKEQYLVPDNQRITMLRDVVISQAPYSRQKQIPNPHYSYEHPRIITSTGRNDDEELKLDAERISVLLFFICFVLPPILFPVYSFGGFDHLMSFFSYGKISRCNERQKRWALWACFPAWVVTGALISVGIWFVCAKKS